MIYNHIIWYHPEEDEFAFESASCQGFFLMSAYGVFLATGITELKPLYNNVYTNKMELN